MFELNDDLLEKVSGGKEKTKDFRIYNPLLLNEINSGDLVSIYSGTYATNDFQFFCNGTVINRVFDESNMLVRVSVLPDYSSILYEFDSQGICLIHKARCEYWFGPRY